MDNEFDSVENFEEIAGPSLTDSVCSPEESADGQKEEIQSEDILCGGCPETVIVAPASPCHTDKYTGPCGTYAAAERQTIQPAGGVSPGDKETKKKREIRINPLALAAVCLICSLIGGIVCLTGYYLVNGKTPGTTSNGSTDGSSKVSSPSGTNTSLTQEITITSDGSVSPAAAVAKKVLPSIVGIEVSVTSASGKYNSVSSVSQGSGVIFTEDSYIITNYHVVEDVLTSAGESNPNATMNVFLYTDPDTAISAELIGYDQGADLAVIKIDRTGLTAVEIGDSDALEVGELAIAIGNPGGLDFLGSVCQGIISGRPKTNIRI